MLTIELTSEEISHLLSLSESEQEEFWSAIPQSEFDSVISQIAQASNGASGADYAAARSAKNAEVINAKTAASQEIGPLHGAQRTRSMPIVPIVRTFENRVCRSVNRRATKREKGLQKRRRRLNHY